MAEPRERRAGPRRDHPVLQRRPTLKVWQSLVLRALLVIGLFGVALAGHWFDRAGLKDNIDGHVSFVDVIYFTTITVTTVGYGDIVPVTDRARLFDTFIVTPVRVFVWIIFLGTAYTFVLRSTWERIRTRMIGNRLKRHSIVCGYGASGAFAANELILSGHKPEDIVVIDLDAERVEAATEAGMIAVCGDATHNAVLESARIGDAAAILVTTDRDDSAALVVLSARQLNHHAVITASARAQENEDLLYQAGATVVLNSVRLGGQLLARAVNNRNAVDFVTDLASASKRVVIRERPAAAADIGRPLAEIDTGLGVRLIRDGAIICSSDPEARRVAAGDCIVEVIEHQKEH